ncbi:MAG: hypothetical protein IT423_14825 [Pirellulaceae bacterium]|nr:hypothetical protein [Pirellulaceae bacterium]
MQANDPAKHTFRLHVISRWLEYEGELRSALIRLLLVSAFYAVQLTHYLVFSSRGEADQMLHRQATYLSAAWLFISMAVVVMISRRWLPPALKYVISLIDIALLTVMAMAGSGASSPLIVVYFLIVVMSGLRGNVKLIWLTTALCLVSYLTLLVLRDQVVGAPFGSEQLSTDGIQPASQPNAQRPIQPVEWMVVTLSLLGTGIVTGQLVRMLRQVVTEVCLRQVASTDGGQEAS